MAKTKRSHTRKAATVGPVERAQSELRKRLRRENVQQREIVKLSRMLKSAIVRADAELLDLARFIAARHDNIEAMRDLSTGTEG